MSLLPSRVEITGDAGPRVVGVDSEDADALMAALSSDTARRLLAELHDAPAPPSELAERTGTSLQNIQYHLERLEGAGAVDVVGTAYSAKGREMDVYGPADQPLVIFAGREESASGLRAALSRLVGGFAALAVASVAIQEVFGDGIGRLFGMGASPATEGVDGGDGGDAGGLAGPTGPATPTETADGVATSASTPARTDGGGVGGDVTDGGATATPAQDVPDTGTPAPEPTATAAETAAGTATDTATAAGGDATVGTVAPSASGTPTTVGDGGVGVGSTATPTATPTSTPIGTVTETATEVVRTTAEAVAAGGDAVTGLPPGLAFFLGGATVLVAVVAVAYLR